MTTGDLVFNPSGVSSAQKQEIGLTLFSIPYAFHSSSPVSIYVVRAISQNRLSNEACGQQGQNVYKTHSQQTGDMPLMLLMYTLPRLSPQPRNDSFSGLPSKDRTARTSSGGCSTPSPEGGSSLKPDNPDC